RVVVDRGLRTAAARAHRAEPAADPAPGAGHRLPRRRGGPHHRQRHHVPLGALHPVRPRPVREDRWGTRRAPLRPGDADHHHGRRWRHEDPPRAAETRGRASAQHAHRPRHRADGGAVSSSPTSPAAAPDPDGAPLGPAASAATAPRPGTARRRTHASTPLATGWKIVVGVLAVLTAQNIAQLLDEFTLQRALIGAGVLVAAAVVAILFSALSWWFTTYAVDEDGVSLHSGMISRSREYAPRARI